MIRLISFGLQYDETPDVGRVVDVRHLRDPYRRKHLRKLRGVDPEVQASILESPEAEHTLGALMASVRDGDVLGLACRMGRHRSVAVAELLAARLRATGHVVQVEHRDIDRGRGQRQKV